MSHYKTCKNNNLPEVSAQLGKNIKNYAKKTQKTVSKMTLEPRVNNRKPPSTFTNHSFQ